VNPTSLSNKPLSTKCRIANIVIALMDDTATMSYRKVVAFLL